jgi:hypothetical protein
MQMLYHVKSSKQRSMKLIFVGIFDGYLFAFLLNSESSGRGAPTFAAKLGSVCADLGSLPDRLTACLLAANVPVKQLLSQKKQATSTCSANLSHTKLMLSLEIP